MDIRIDPEFENKIPPLTEEEFKHLEELILEDGRVKQSIVTWNGVIVDGHHRWKIIQKHPEIPYEIEEKQFADKWAAFDWMYKNQLGRRNLTEEQKTYLIGKMYESRKHAHGGQLGNLNASKRSGQNDQFVLRKEQRAGTAGEIGKEFGLKEKSVRRAEQFAKGIDAIREESPDLAMSILTGEKNVRKSDVRAIGAATEDRLGMIESIMNGRSIDGRSEVERTCDRTSGREIREIISAMSDDSDMEYTIEHLVDQIRVNADGFVRMLRNLIGDHRDLCKNNMKIVLKTIHDEVISPVEQMIKEKLNNEA